MMFKGGARAGTDTDSLPLCAQQRKWLCALPVVATSHPTPTRLLLPARHKVVLVMSLNLAASRACCTCNALQRQRMLQFLCHAHKHTILSLVHSNRIIM